MAKAARTARSEAPKKEQREASEKSLQKVRAFSDLIRAVTKTNYHGEEIEAAENAAALALDEE